MGTATVLIMTVALLPIGALVASRQPENPLGWIFTGTAFFFALGFAAYEYAVYAYLVRPGTPGGELAAWIETWFWFPALTLPFSLLILLFPNGQPAVRPLAAAPVGDPGRDRDRHRLRRSDGRIGWTASSST